MIPTEYCTFITLWCNAEALNEDCGQDDVKYGGCLIHVWSGVHYLGKTQLCILRQNVTGALYCEILEQNLVPHVHNYSTNNLVLIDDNAATSRANIVHEYLTGGILCMLIGHRTLQIWTQCNTCGMNWATDWKEYIVSPWKLGHFLAICGMLSQLTKALVDSVPHCVLAFVGGSIPVNWTGRKIVKTQWCMGLSMALAPKRPLGMNREE